MMNFKIINFKCYYDTDIPLNYLTVLAGANGNGKSTVIQALLMMRNAYEHMLNKDEDIEINGPYCLSLGTTLNIIPVEAERNSTMVLSMAMDDKKVTFSFPLSDEHANLSLKMINSHALNGMEQIPLFKKEFYYLNAERIGPRVAQEIKVYKYPNVGWQGEYCAQILSELSSVRDFNVDNSRVCDMDKSHDVLTQTQLWMQQLFPGIVIQSTPHIESLSAQLTISNNYTSGTPTLSTNVGFGVSYVLPIIVTGLIAEKGSIMIVENPEAHLHPSAQTSVAEFISRVAQSGVYVIVETHSDHFIDGIQLAVADKSLNSENVTINYVNQSGITHRPEIKTISMSKNAELSEWPDGFFNQTQKNYAKLYNLRRNG